MNYLKSRERGFTLIELLVVTVVIVTLMGIVFRLSNVGGDSRAKSKTQARLQRLENAISGYYAAYGSYPPVPLQGRSRDIHSEVRSRGIQGTSMGQSGLNQRQIEAACRAQPVAVLYPFFLNTINQQSKSDDDQLVTALASTIDSSGNLDSSNLSFSLDPLDAVGGLNLGRSDEATLFQFGLLSFLMPRYLFMLRGHSEFYDTPNSEWANNNQLPCRIDTGRPYESWESIQKVLFKSSDPRESFLVTNLTSQTVCARWMPNFEGIVSGGETFYGVDTSDDDWPFLSSVSADGKLRQYDANPGSFKWVRLFSAADNQSSSGNNNGNLYILNGMTVADGWGREFYYYSDPPYQSYRLWSAGSNGLTFPPWLDVDKFGSGEQRTITDWTKDDICHLAD